MSPPVLIPLTPGQPLLLYLTINKESLVEMLAQKGPTDAKERAIYYLSKKFFVIEMNNSNVKKTCATLMRVLHRLRQYTLHYQICLVTENDPIKYLLEQLALMGKLAKWQILISEFDVQSVSQKSIKGQAIVDLLANNSTKTRNEDKQDLSDNRILTMKEETWTMFFDGAINLFGSGTSAILISPNGQHYPVAAKLVFPCTNNIA